MLNDDGLIDFGFDEAGDNAGGEAGEDGSGRAVVEEEEEDADA